MNPEVTITQFQQIFFRISNIIQDRQGFPLKIGFFRILFRISYRFLRIIIENGIFTNPEITTAQFQQIFFRIAKDFYYKKRIFQDYFSGYSGFLTFQGLSLKMGFFQDF